MKECLLILISDKQSAFVEGRMLTDNALVAFELNHYISRKRQGKNGVASLKLMSLRHMIDWNGTILRL